MRKALFGSTRKFLKPALDTTMQLARRDILRIEDLMVHAKIGISEEERAYPQRLLLSAAIETDLEEAVRSKDVSKGLCYATLSQQFLERVQSQEWVLVEELADELSKLLFEHYSAARSLRLSIKKFAVPGCAWVGIEIERARG